MPGDELDFADEQQPSAPPPKAPLRASESPADYDPGIPPDSFWQEERPPARPPSRPRAVEPSVREMPHSIEAEECLLALCLLDGAEIIGRCLKSRIGKASFYNTNHALIFDALVELYFRNAKIIDVSVLAEELKTRGQLEEVGSYAFLAQVSARMPTTAQAEYFLEKVRGYAIRREIIRTATGAVEDAFGHSGEIDELVGDVTSRIAQVVESARSDLAIKATPLIDVGYPTGSDPNILLGSDDYLGRGGGMLFVSHAGAGKSSFIMDACMSWAIGEPWVGIKCNGPLRSLIIQAEDSSRYQGKVAQSFAFARGLTQEQRSKLRSNCVICDVNGITGDAFFAEVERLVKIHQPDIVVLNPIYLYAQGDISKAEYAQPFLVGLDRLNREKRWGWILVHHTGKPAQKDGKGKRADLDDWETIYMGFGSSYLANWPRCSALLEPRAGERGRYYLKLGKAGSNAGVTRKVSVQDGVSYRLEPTTRIALKYSDKKMPIAGEDRQVIFWEVDEDDSDSSKKPERGASKGGRPKEYRYNDFHDAFAERCSKATGNRLGFGVLKNIVMGFRGKCADATIDRLIQEGIELGRLAKDTAGYHTTGS